MAIMTAIVVYVIPGLLGRSYDLKNETVGPDLFKTDETAKAKKIERYLTTTEYKIVSELSEATDFLDVSGKLSLKLKIGAANVEGTGNYLKETKSFQKRVDLLVKVHFETIVETLPTTIKPMANWQDLIKDSSMTHYIRSINYGGDLIASVRFTTTTDEDKETIKGLLQGELSSKSGSFGAGLKANLEKIQSKTSSSASMDINYFATVPIESIPRTIEGLTELVEKFPEQTKKINNGYGVPLSMEVFSLEALNRDTKTYYQTLALGDQMVILDEQFSDIRQAKQRLSDWLKTIPPVLEKAEKDKIGLFQTHLDEVDKIFAKTIANLDLTATADADQFKEAFAAYQGNRTWAIPSMYVKDLSKLKKEVLDGTKSIETDFGGSQYTYWGADTCPAVADTKTVFKGVMSSTDSAMVGSSQFTCMPDDRQYPDVKEQSGGEEEIDDFPQVQPVGYVSRKKGGDSKKVKVKCSYCRVPGKTANTMLPGTESCPANWTQHYKGILVSTDYQQIRGEMVCLDISKGFPEKNDLPSVAIITEVSPKCESGSYPCSEGLSDTTAIPCVVCSIKKKADSKADFLRV